MKIKPLIFLTTPITPRSPTQNHAIEFLGYIRRAAKISLNLIKEGACVYDPANDFPYWLVGPGIPPSGIYNQDISVIAHCDIVVFTSDYSVSANCIKEITLAKKMGIPVFQYPKNLGAICKAIKKLTREENL